jgi:hypothetical protein
MRFRAHESFFIRKGWLYKGLKNIEKRPRVFSDRSINPSDEFGIGTNMVRSLRYWLQATGLTREENDGNYRIQVMTDLGKLIMAHDRYMEEEGTLWLIHYKLASNQNIATAWYWFFNEFNLSEFSKEDFVKDLDGYIRFNLEEGDGIALSSLEDDFTCILNTYIARNKMHPEKVSPENNIDCPLGQLGLVDIVDRKKRIFRKNTPRQDDIHPMVVLAAIVDQNAGQTEIKISRLLQDPCNIGRIFNFDILVLSQYLDKLARLGLITVIRTGGLDVVRLLGHLTFHRCIERYFVEINGDDGYE